MPVLIGVWVLAVVLTAACLVWVLLAPGSDPTASAQATPTKTAAAQRTVAPAVQTKSATVAPTQAPAGVTKPAPTAANPTAAAPQPTAKPGTLPTATTLPINEKFGYGIQVNGLNDYDASERSINMVSQLQMTWIKQQVKWGVWKLDPAKQDYLDRLVRKANKSNIKIMLSVVTAPAETHPGVKPDPKEDPDNIKAPPDDPNAYANFVAQLVERYKSQGYSIHAIEVWNEQNLSREWRTSPQRIDASKYIQLLAATYKRVKAIDPNIIIISGAPSPTGVDDGVDAVDDLKYIQQMMNYGLANYADCVGVHHNGINLPPDVAYQDAPKHPKAATATFRGPFDNPHHSWSFFSTLNQTAQIVKPKPLCITEFGWPSSQGISTPVRQGFEFSRDNSLQDQANYIVKAFQLMKQWGFVKIAFLWNLNFNTVTDDPTTTDNAIYSILDANGLSRPAFDALGKMQK